MIDKVDQDRRAEVAGEQGPILRRFLREPDTKGKKYLSETISDEKFKNNENNIFLR